MPKFVELHLELCRRCLLKCVHCSSDLSGLPDEPTFQIASWKQFIEASDPDYRFHVFYTGGEPLYCRDLDSWVKSAISTGRVDSLGLFTSGMLFDESSQRPESISKRYARHLKQIGVSLCYVSLYSYSSDIHDSIVKVSGAHAVTVKSIENLQSAGIDVRCHFVPMKLNTDDIESYISFVQSLGIGEIRYLRLVEHGSAENAWDAIGVDYSKQLEFAIAMHEFIEQIESPVRMTIAGFPDVFNCRPVASGIKCQAGIGLYYIDWKGQVFPCACTKNQSTKVMMNLGSGSIGLRISDFGDHSQICFQDAD